MLVHILEAHQEENNFMAAKLEFIIRAHNNEQLCRVT